MLPVVKLGYVVSFAEESDIKYSCNNTLQQRFIYRWLSREKGIGIVCCGKKVQSTLVRLYFIRRRPLFVLLEFKEEPQHIFHSPLRYRFFHSITSFKIQEESRVLSFSCVLLVSSGLFSITNCFFPQKCLSCMHRIIRHISTSQPMRCFFSL